MSPHLTSGKLNHTLRLGKIKKKRGTLISMFGYFLWGNDNRGKKEIYWYFLRSIEFSRGILGWDGTGTAPLWGANAAGGPSAGPATQPPCRRLRESQKQETRRRKWDWVGLSRSTCSHLWAGWWAPPPGAEGVIGIWLAGARWGGRGGEEGNPSPPFSTFCEVMEIQ